MFRAIFLEWNLLKHLDQCWPLILQSLLKMFHSPLNLLVPSLPSYKPMEGNPWNLYGILSCLWKTIIWTLSCLPEMVKFWKSLTGSIMHQPEIHTTFMISEPMIHSMVSALLHTMEHSLKRILLSDGMILERRLFKTLKVTMSEHKKTAGIAIGNQTIVQKVLFLDLLVH